MSRAACVFGMVGLCSVAHGQGWNDWTMVVPRTVRGHQGEAAKKLMPVSLELRPHARPTGEPRALRVRVYAAADYRLKAYA
jgi:hypothetical protein